MFWPVLTNGALIMSDHVNADNQNPKSPLLTPEAVAILKEVKDTLRTQPLSAEQLTAANGAISRFVGNADATQYSAADGAYRDTAYQDRYQDTPYRDTSTYNDTPSYRDAPKDP
jgi:hypothetical protein